MVEEEQGGDEEEEEEEEEGKRGEKTRGREGWAVVRREVEEEE